LPILLFQFFVEALAFTAFIVFLLARKRGGPKWLSAYAVFMLACLFYAIVRNVGFFVESFAPREELERNMVYFLFYNLGNSVFSLVMVWNGFLLAENPMTRWRKAVVAVSASPPLAALLIGGAWGLLGGRDRLPFFFSASMLSTFAAYAAIQAYIAASYRKIKGELNKKLVIVNNAAGALYFALSLGFYLRSLDREFYLDSFWILNLSFVVLFIGSIVFACRRHLVDPDPAGFSREALPADIDRGEAITDMFMSGYSNKRIAEELGVSVAIVKNRIFKLFRHFGVQSRSQLIYRLRSDPPSRAGRPNRP